jgi:hypothetical protein
VRYEEGARCLAMARGGLDVVVNLDEEPRRMRLRGGAAWTVLLAWRAPLEVSAEEALLAPRSVALFERG